MPNCRSCGCRIGCDSFEGVFIRETGEFVCDGCYDKDCDEDRKFCDPSSAAFIDDYELEVAKNGEKKADAALNHWEHRADDAYEQTDKTAPLTDIGDTE